MINGSQNPSTTSHYDANYGNFHAELYAEIRREAFGEDIGQTSWLTVEEQDRFLGQLQLSEGKRLLDIACGSGGPALRIAERTGCSVTGIDLHEQAIATARRLALQRKVPCSCKTACRSKGSQRPWTHRLAARPGSPSAGWPSSPRFWSIL